MKKKKCPKCSHYRIMTRHHILPLRNFGYKDNRLVLFLCRPCHNMMEKEIIRREYDGGMTAMEYVKITFDFLNGG